MTWRERETQPGTFLRTMVARLDIGADGTIADMNDPFCVVSGLSRHDFVGRSSTSLDAPDDRDPDTGFSSVVRRVLSTGRPWKGELRGQARGGGAYWLAAGVIPVGSTDSAGSGPIVLPDGRGTGGCVVFGVDITARVARAENAREGLHRDPVVGLLNQEGFRVEATAALEGAGENGARRVLVIADVDGFSEASKRCGVEVGEELLRVIARRLVAWCGADAVLGRYGGDEFSIFCTAPHSDATLRTQMERLREYLSRDALIGGIGISFSLSIGYTRTRRGDAVASMMQRAKLAVLAAKAEGGGRVAAYAPGFEASVRRRQALLAEARLGFGAGEFVAHYQPVVDLRTGAPCACEALVRWNHPVHGLLSPGKFADLFEDFALVSELGRNIRQFVIGDLVRWRRENRFSGAVAINFGMADLHDPENIVRLADDLERNGLSVSDVIIEVSETTVLKGGHAAVVRERLREFAERGFPIAFDDFGTGHASLTHLRELPLDIIKIDRRFIASMVRDSREFALTSGMIDLAHRLGLKVIAEGVETHEQLGLLEDCGCDMVQGFLLARPVEASALPDALRHSAALFAGFEE